MRISECSWTLGFWRKSDFLAMILTSKLRCWLPGMIFLRSVISRHLMFLLLASWIQFYWGAPKILLAKLFSCSARSNSLTFTISWFGSFPIEEGVIFVELGFVAMDLSYFLPELLSSSFRLLRSLILVPDRHGWFRRDWVIFGGIFLTCLVARVSFWLVYIHLLISQLTTFFWGEIEASSKRPWIACY